MDIREKLARYPKLHSEVLALFRRLEELEQSGRKDEFGELENIERRVMANQEEMSQLLRMIDRLEPEERQILKLRYIDGINWRPVMWKDVCIKLYGSAEVKHIQAAKRLHRRAITALERG